jgi:hypothetical protein
MTQQSLARQAYERFYQDGPPGVSALHAWCHLVSVVGAVIADECEHPHTDGTLQHDMTWPAGAVAAAIRTMTSDATQTERDPHPRDHAPYLH